MPQTDAPSLPDSPPTAAAVAADTAVSVLSGLTWVARSVVVIDIIESVRLIQEDPEDVIARWQRFDATMRGTVLPMHHGRLVKSLGDGMLLEFDTATDAIAAARQAHREVEALNAGRPAARAIRLRAGITSGEVVVGEIDIYGHTVNLAARLASLGGAGQTVISASVRSQIVAGLDAEIEDLGDCILKHVAQPVRAFLIQADTPDVHALEPAPLAQWPVQPLRPTIAVVPFETEVFSGDSLSLRLGEALADEITCSLSRNGALKVISQLSAAAFAGRSHRIAAIRQHLRVDHVLTGRLYADGDRLALTLQLVETRTESVLWSDRVKNASMRGVFCGDDPMITDLSHRVGKALTSRQVERARTEPLASLESYCLLMAAITLMHGVSREDFERARLMLEALIERDRRHPLPHAWLAKWHVLRVQQGWSDDLHRDSLQASDCTRRALDLDPRSSLSLTMDGFVQSNLHKDLDGAMLRYRQALDENQNEPLAWLLLGTSHAFRGEGQAATEAAEQALELSPLDPMRYFFESLSATAALSAGQHELAIRRARRSLQLNRQHTSTLRVITIAQACLGRLDEARATCSELMRLEPSLTISSYRRRSPSTGHPTGDIWCDALAAAGVPPG
ncbi:adenylate/guanylate cyclase domain-containing protein [Sphaerotilus uruguayifluvii]|uniref:Class 3 adenylate cyclase n=1 Tax=Sphaerotilus uruguayifluvii TaxID=2735897 RepID=A0ABX2FZ44_9BURK|nr:adenylate/guanylate cyclase domain-containing protein [Leptothrix sp. C29]NRT54504.1 class 3 adenylate cyclase [Leptothrix sp. C29]